MALASIHSCYIFSAFCSIKHFRISCRFRCFTADFRSTAAAPILGSCDPIIGPVAGALQSQRDALAHRAWLTREQSSIENDVGIQVTHLLVLCHLTDEKLNKTTVKLWKFAILTQNLDYFNVSIYSLKIQNTFGNWPPWIAASRCKMTMVMPCFLQDFHNVRIRADGWNCIHCAVGTLRIECRCNFWIHNFNAKLCKTCPLIGPCP